MLLDIAQTDRRREKNSGFALGTVEFSRNDELGFGEGLRFAEAGASAIRQQVSAPLFPRLADGGPGQAYPSSKPVHSSGSTESVRPRASSLCQRSELRLA